MNHDDTTSTTQIPVVPLWFIFSSRDSPAQSCHCFFAIEQNQVNSYLPIALGFDDVFFQTQHKCNDLIGLLLWDM